MSESRARKEHFITAWMPLVLAFLGAILVAAVSKIRTFEDFNIAVFIVLLILQGMSVFLIYLAKAPQIKAKKYFQFGISEMSVKRRILYFVGYFFLILFLILEVLFVFRVSTMKYPTANPIPAGQSVK